ncbi:hypothetical protein A4G99_10895 [Haladaptatus sp. R4]|nr:hypothetical protein [Haladaptatus sp. R4]KZN24824.1 hypothetical protein A4G99_10895 [Haladaptatus sp. R4]
MPSTTFSPRSASARRTWSPCAAAGAAARQKHVGRGGVFRDGVPNRVRVVGYWSDDLTLVAPRRHEIGKHRRIAVGLATLHEFGAGAEDADGERFADGNGRDADVREQTGVGRGQSIPCGEQGFVSPRGRPAAEDVPSGFDGWTGECGIAVLLFQFGLLAFQNRIGMAGKRRAGCDSDRFPRLDLWWLVLRTDVTDDAERIAISGGERVAVHRRPVVWWNVGGRDDGFREDTVGNFRRRDLIRQPIFEKRCTRPYRPVERCLS